jgi:hypothetical protein
MMVMARVQQYDENHEQYVERGGLQEVELTEAERGDIANDVAWIERLGGFYLLAESTD